MLFSFKKWLLLTSSQFPEFTIVTEVKILVSVPILIILPTHLPLRVSTCPVVLLIQDSFPSSLSLVYLSTFVDSTSVEIAQQSLSDLFHLAIPSQNIHKLLNMYFILFYIAECNIPLCISHLLYPPIYHLTSQVLKHVWLNNRCIEHGDV